MAKLVLGNDKTVVTPAIIIKDGKYSLFNRVKDDNNNEVGTVCGYHIDANNIEYAVVALDAVYRLAAGQLTSGNTAVTGLPLYGNPSVYSAKETATFNCDKIIAQCTTSGWTSSALTHCRAQIFTVGGVQYAGQIPTIMELLKILEYREVINTIDTTASTNPTLIIPNNQNMWSTSAYNAGTTWCIRNLGGVSNYNRTNSYFIAPVLEIPNR